MRGQAARELHLARRVFKLFGCIDRARFVLHPQRRRRCMRNTVIDVTVSFWPAS